MTTYVQDTVAENQVLPQLSVKPDVSIFKNGRLYVHSSVDRARLYNALLLVCKHQGSFCLASDDEGEAIQLRKECFSFYGVIIQLCMILKRSSSGISILHDDFTSEHWYLYWCG